MSIATRCCLALVLVAAWSALPARAHCDPKGGALQSSEGTVTWKTACPCAPANQGDADNKDGADLVTPIATGIAAAVIAIVIALAAGCIASMVTEVRRLEIENDFNKAQLREGFVDAKGAIEAFCAMITALSGRVTDPATRAALAKTLKELSETFRA